MTIVVAQQPFWRMVRVLRDFEGWRCLWRVPIAGLLRVLPWVVGLAGGVGAIYIAANLEFVHVVVGVLAGAVSTTAATWLARREPWRSIIAGRLWTYERPEAVPETSVLVQPASLDRSVRALRRDKLNTARARAISAPPPNAPTLTTEIVVVEPSAWARSGSDADRIVRIAEILKGANVRARVAGRDVFPSTSEAVPDG